MQIFPMITVGVLRGYHWPLNGLRNWFIKRITVNVSVRNIHKTAGWCVKFHQDLSSSLPEGVTLVTCNLKEPGFYNDGDNEQYHIACKLSRCANKFRIFEAERETATKNVI